MQNERLYTLEQLAQEFDLTPRTARHYLEKLLPEGHRKGRGKLAIYGRDTWNCFAFIQKARDELNLNTGQIVELLNRLSNREIERVVRGEQEVAIVTTPAGKEDSDPPGRARFYAPRGYVPEEDLAPTSMMREAGSERWSAEQAGDLLASELPSYMRTEMAAHREPEEWRTIYQNDSLQIQLRNPLTGKQAEDLDFLILLAKRLFERGD